MKNLLILRIMLSWKALAHHPYEVGAFKIPQLASKWLNMSYSTIVMVYFKLKV